MLQLSLLQGNEMKYKTLFFFVFLLLFVLIVIVKINIFDEIGYVEVKNN